MITATWKVEFDHIGETTTVFVNLEGENLEDLHIKFQDWADVQHWKGYDLLEHEVVDAHLN